MRRLVRFFAMIACTLFACSSFATTYYVDYSAGNDANNGTSKSTPWQNAPGMQTCSGKCKSTTINPGDSIILRGGVTWPNASFMWSLPGGSSSSPVYVGVDKTWYAGSGWARPTLNAGGTAISDNYDTMFSVPDNVTFDNFEVTGFYWSNSTCSSAPYGDCSVFNAGQRSGQTFENLYIHGWTHAGTNAATSNGTINIFAFGGNGQGVAHDNVIVGTDVPGDHSVEVFFNGPGTAYNNYIKQVSSGAVVSYPVSWHDNHIEDIGPAYCNMPFPANAGHCTHENGFEDNGDIGLYFYNNVITNINGGLALWVAPNPGHTAYLWNNLIYAVHDNQVLDLAPPVYSSSYCSSGADSQSYCNSTGTYWIANNTIQCGDDSTQYDICQSGVGVNAQGSTPDGTVFQNNHFVSATTAKGCASTAHNCTFASSNVVMAQATATSQGYTSSETYPFSPAASTSGTVGAGASLSSSASGNLSSLAVDTTLACSDTAGNTPTCPVRTAKSRTGASWDAGAYAWGIRPSGAVNLTGSIVAN